MLKKRSILLLITGLMGFQIVFSQEIIWENIVEVDFTSRSNITVDQQDNIYVCFSNLYHYTLGSYDKDGILRWGFSDTSMGFFGGFYGDETGMTYITGAFENAQTHSECIYKVFDNKGVLQNQGSYSASAFSQEAGSRIIADEAGNIFVNGLSRTGNDYGIFTLKIDQSGMIVWAQHENLKDYSIPIDLKQDDAGNIYSLAYTGVHSDTILTTLVKYDPEGIMLYSKELELDGYPGLILGNINFDNQGNLIMGGYAHINYADDGCVMKTDTDGNTIWSRTFHASSGLLGIFDLDLDDNDNIYVCGRITKNDDDAYYAKLNSNGDVDWEYVYEGPGASLDEFRKVIYQNGYCYFAGIETGISTKWDFLILKTDLAGDNVWKITYDGNSHKTDDFEDICFDSENNIVIGGFTEIELFHHNGVTMKYSNPLSINEITMANPVLEIYPNPAENFLRISSDHISFPLNYKILDVQGRFLEQGEVIDRSDPQIDLMGLSQGIYFLQIDDGHKQYNAKFVKN